MKTLLDFCSSPEREQSAGRPETIRRVLIVEDDPITRLVALQQLKMLGCAPQAASSGTEALEALRADRFDLILMDCRLPHVNGYETVRAIRIRERFSERERVAIVAITGDADVECVDKCFSAGMDGYVSKPVSIGIMRDVLSRFM